VLSLTTRSCIALLVINSILGSKLDATNAPVESSDVVKISVAATKPDGDGKQTILVTLTVIPSYHILANPVDNAELTKVQTSIRIYSAGRPVEADVSYPSGQLVDPGQGLSFRIYEGKVTIKAIVVRTKQNAGPLEIVSKVRAANSQLVLRPSSIKSTVP
jgi:hypothetical protein